MNRHAVLVAGGTGGHINAAIALGERLASRGWDVAYLTGERPLDYKLFHGLPVTHLGSWPLRTRNPLKLLASLARNLLVFLSILLRFLRKRPAFIVGAGGYVCGPTLLAGRMLGVPVFIIEQNAVLGLTNKLLARMSGLIFTHFRRTRGLPASLAGKVRVVGNPTRKSIAPPPSRDVSSPPLRILVFGGSLGATQVNELVAAWARRDHADPVEIIHQTGNDVPPDWKPGRNVSYSAHRYLDRIQEQYAWCDVVVARAGASTVAELRIVRKPCFLVPFPQATDNHQWWNAKEFQEEGVCPVEVVEPRAPQDEMLRRLDAFLSRPLTPFQAAGAAVDSAESTLREIFAHVGYSQKK